jgi:hypothetical protein
MISREVIYPESAVIDYRDANVGDVLRLEVALVDQRTSHVRPAPAAVIDAVSPASLAMWCTRRNIHGVTTTELVDYLRGLIGGQRAVEVCAGAAGLGRALGIPMTDSYDMRDAFVQGANGLVPSDAITYPSDVERLDAYGAVLRHRPDVVVASWPVQRRTRMPNGRHIGAGWGVDEAKLLSRVRTYIVIGNTTTQGLHAIASVPHEVHRFPWLRACTGAPAAENAVFVWHRT